MVRLIVNFLVITTFLANLQYTFSDDSSTPTFSRIRTSGRHFVDEQGRVMQFRGVNSVEKEPPWVPNHGHRGVTNRTHLENLKKWGFNCVRLGVMWAGVVPEKNQTNQTYLAEMLDIVDLVASYGMYVILEFHQDMMSSKFQSYDGVPLWVINELPNSKYSFPWPMAQRSDNESIVFLAYLTEACGFAYQCLYENVNKFGDYFQDYWREVVKTFANRPSVLGYEIINEPWAGNIYNNPLYILPGYTGHWNLLPLYDKTYETIRSLDNETLIFYEPVTWGTMSSQTVFNTGFSRPPANDKTSTVFSWHYYCWLYQFNPKPLVNGKFKLADQIFCDVIQLKASFESVEDTIEKLGGSPTFLTEFGLCNFYIENRTQNVEECNYILAFSDQYLQSWTYWDSDFYFYNENSTEYDVNQDLVNSFSRVYPMATHGIPTELYYHVDTKDFMYVFRMNATANQSNLTTDIFIPSFVYPTGFNVTLSEHLVWSFDNDSSLLTLSFSESVLEQFLSNSSFVFTGDSRIIINSNSHNFTFESVTPIFNKYSWAYVLFKVFKMIFCLNLV